MQVSVGKRPSIRPSLREMTTKFTRNLSTLASDALAAGHALMASCAQVLASMPVLAAVVVRVDVPQRLHAVTKRGSSAEQSKHARRFAFRMTHERAVALSAALASIGAYIWYARQNLILAYSDGVAHLMIARRVVAGHAIGLGQLGTNWLPLHHLLMVPLIWNDALWHSGLAGSIPSMCAYVVASLFVFRLARLMSGSLVASWAAAAVFMLNPSVLYMQVTPMSESDLLCFTTVATYYAIRWVQSRKAADVVIAAAVIAADTLVRYDAWFVAAVLFCLIVVIAWRRWGFQVAHAYAILFGLLGLAGGACWILYNQLLYGSPTAFLNGVYSAAYMEDQIANTTGLASKHNIIVSLHIYAQAVVDTAGLPLVLMSLLGLLIWCLWRTSVAMKIMVVGALLAPFLFNVLSLYVGATIIEVPEYDIGHYLYFNDRYALGMIPAIALLVGMVVARCNGHLKLAPTILMAAMVIVPLFSTPFLLFDPLVGSGAAGRLAGPTGGQWLASHYAGGEILISYSPQSNVMFFSGLPLNDFITDSDGVLYQNALAQPQQYAEWVVMDTSTSVYNPIWTQLSGRADWRQHYVLRATIGSMLVYQRIGSN